MSRRKRSEESPRTYWLFSLVGIASAAAMVLWQWWRGGGQAIDYMTTILFLVGAFYCALKAPPASGD